MATRPFPHGASSSPERKHGALWERLLGPYLGLGVQEGFLEEGTS